MQYDNMNMSRMWFDPIDFITGDYLDQREPVRTHMPGVDAMLSGGLQPGVWNIMAEPGAGKSAFGLQMAFFNAFEKNTVDEKNTVVYVSLEMPAHQCWARIASSLSKTDTGRDMGLEPFMWSDVPRLGRETARRLRNADGDLERWRVTEADDAFVKATKQLMRVCPNLLITDAPEARNIETLQYIVRTVAASSGATLVVIDYMQQIVTEPGAKVYDRVTQVSAALKDIANEMKIPLLVIVSMNRETMRGKDPDMHGGAGSSSIEYDAVGVITLQNDKDESTPECRHVKLKVHKNRYGQSGGGVTLEYFPAYNLFREIGVM